MGSGGSKNEINVENLDHNEILRYFFSKKKSKFDDDISLSITNKILRSKDYSENTKENVIDIFIIGKGDLQKLVDRFRVYRLSSTTVKYMLSKRILKIDRKLLKDIVMIKDPELLKSAYNMAEVDCREELIESVRKDIYYVNMSVDDLYYRMYKALEEVSGEQFQMTLSDYIYRIAIEMMRYRLNLCRSYPIPSRKIPNNKKEEYLKILDKKIQYGFVTIHGSNSDKDQNSLFRSFRSEYEQSFYEYYYGTGTRRDPKLSEADLRLLIRECVDDITGTSFVRNIKKGELNDEIIEIVLE